MNSLQFAFQTSRQNLSHTKRLPSICQLTLRRHELPPPFCSHRVWAAPFSSTTCQLARSKGAPKKDRRITLIRYFLHHPTTLVPRPLRLSRNRSLRHWTIHRAWQLFQSNRRAARRTELQHQYDAMRDACEELRIGAGDGGRLFRKAMMKTGVFDVGDGMDGRPGVPMDYARGMVDYVGSVDSMGVEAKVWDEGWKRK